MLSTLNLLALRGKGSKARTSRGTCGGCPQSPTLLLAPSADCTASATAADSTTGEGREAARRANGNPGLGAESTPAASAPSAAGGGGRRRQLSGHEFEKEVVGGLVAACEVTVHRVVLGDKNSDGGDDVEDEGRNEGDEEEEEEERGEMWGVGDESGERPTFVLVAKEHLVGTWLAVFVRASMLPQVSDVRSGKKKKPGWSEGWSVVVREGAGGGGVWWNRVL